MVFEDLSRVDALSYAVGVALESLSSLYQDLVDLSLVGEGEGHLLFNGIYVSFSNPMLVGSLLVACKLWVNRCLVSLVCRGSLGNEALNVPVRGSSSIGSGSLLLSPLSFPGSSLGLISGLISFSLNV